MDQPSYDYHMVTKTFKLKILHLNEFKTNFILLQHFFMRMHDPWYLRLVRLYWKQEGSNS